MIHRNWLSSLRNRNLSNRSRVRVRRRWRGNDHTSIPAVQVLEDRTLLAAWVAEGPGPATNGQVENVSPNGEVIGAIHTVLAHPTDADVVYVGGTNGGIWKTENATATSPNWTPLTDDQQSLSIGAMTFDVADTTHETIWAGIGRYSSFGQFGGDRTGLLKSTDGGDSWTAVDGGGVLVGKNISGIAVDGDDIVVSVNVADSFTFGNIGIFRSTNGGASFTQISTGNGSATGLPGGVTYDLVRDPANPDTLYTSTIFSDIVGGQNGIYKSTNFGASWTKVSNSTIDALLTNSVSNVEFAHGPTNVFVGIVQSGNPTGFFRSNNAGTSWVQLDNPQTNENGTDVGLNPRGGKGPQEEDNPAPEELAGGQGSIHFSIAADPNDGNIVYVGGDRQPRTFGDTGGFPNSIGATNFTGRLFRGDITASAGNQWVHLTHSDSLGASGGGTASSSSPHADSREIVFDANGNIIEVDDGGVYRRTSPQDNTGDWFSINGDLQMTEAHDVAYDTLNNRIATGNQDTGTTVQTVDNSTTFFSLSTADGGDVVFDNSNPNEVVFYSSFQNLGAFRRTTFDANRNVTSSVLPNLTVDSGAAFDPDFDTPVILNQSNSNRLLFLGDNGIYESTNRGDNITQIRADTNLTSTFFVDAAYGGGGVENGFYVGNSNGEVLVRGASSTITTTDTGSGDDILDVAIDDSDFAHAFAIDSNQVFETTNTGTTWSDITGNLLSTFGIDRLFTLQFVEDAVSGDALIVGTERGVYKSVEGSFNVWERLGTGIPNAPVVDMLYDMADDLLIVSTMGRGTWSLAAPVGDSTAPTVDSFRREIPAQTLTNFDSLVFRATFSEDVQNVDAGDFIVNGSTTATVTGVSQVTANEYDVTVSGGDLAVFNGTVGLDLAGGQNITDISGNALTGGEPTTDETYTLDNTSPVLQAFTRQTPSSSPTNVDTLVFQAVFSEGVQNVDASDFSVSGSTTATVTAVGQLSADSYTVTVSGGNLASFNGTVGLDLAGGQNVTDLAGNGLPAVEPATDEIYTVDNSAPTLQSFTRQSPTAATTGADTLVFRATFSEAVANVDTGDFAVNGSTTATVTSVALVSAGVYDVTVSGGDLANFNGTVGLDLAGGQNVTDLAGNGLPAVEPATDEIYTVDNTAPTLQSFTRQNPAAATTGADTLVFRATFSEAVANVDTGDFAVNGSTTATVTSVALVSAGVYDVTVSGGDLANFTGTVGLNLAGGQNVTDLVGIALPNGEPATDETYTAALVVDNDDPGYSEFGSGWANSGLTGVDGSGTRFSSSPGAGATWRLPAGRPAGWYTVRLFNVKHPSNATNARVTVVHSNGTESRGLSQRDAPNGFTTIGTFFFDGSAKEAITLQNRAGGILRADAIQITAAAQPPTLVIDNGQAGYTEFGPGWANSGLTGNGGSGTRFNPNAGAGFFYRPPAGFASSWYEVELFNVQHPSNTENARVIITHGGATEIRILDQRNTANGFVSLGRIYFDGVPDQSVRIENLGGGVLRADAIRFTAVAPPGPGTIDDGQPGYSEFGDGWANSGLTGVDGSGTRFSANAGAGATWRPPANLAAGWYTLDLFNVQHPSNTTNARITIKHAGNTQTRTINPQTTPNGFRPLGTFYFDGSGSEAVTLQNLAGGILRADALRIRATPPPIPGTIDNGEPGYSEFGSWADSGLTGLDGSGTRFTTQTGAGATYRPTNFPAGFYDVLVFNVQHPSNTTNARVTIKHAGVTDTRTLDQRATSTGFTSLGTFFFDGAGSEAITLQNLGGVLRTDAVRLRATTPPQAQQTLTQQAAPGEIANSNAPSLATGDLDSLIDDALAAWASVGVDPSAFDGVRFAIGDLAGNVLGTYSSGLVTIDVNAAGHGWFVDTTPEDDAEFTGAGPAGFDLFTVLKHELGHHLGLADEADGDGSLLETELNLGERRHVTETEIDLLANRDLVDELLNNA